MPSKLKKPDYFSHEHRLGLVVYGGVSLAIYMNGICQEFYNAVRGRGIYKLIKALTDADIVVDIISGTSAGGINGVLLSYALANSQGQKTNSTQKDEKIRHEIQFEKFASVWKESGDIQKLLFSKKDDGYSKTSFLDGDDYYKKKIEQALKNSFDNREKAREEDWFSKFGELDLFVTGTDVLGRIEQVFDNTGCVIDVKDHKTIFHLKYREFGENDFKIEEKNEKSNDIDKREDNNQKSNDITYEALAKLCQITSSYPVAFPLVTVRLNTENDADEKLVEWGNLKKNRFQWKEKPKKSDSSNQDLSKTIDNAPGEGYCLHFVDGGVLNNRPFSYTIKEIYQRRAHRPVFRKLFYIDPSPDSFHELKNNEMPKPDIVQVVQGSLFTMPKYQSINNDLELIKAHNQKIRRYNFLVADIEEQLDNKVPREISEQQRNVYLRTRLISLKDNILPLIFLESDDCLVERNSINCNKAEQRNSNLDKVAKLLANRLTDPEKTCERLKFLKELQTNIQFLDIEYTLRRYYFISDYVYRLLNRKYLHYWSNKKHVEFQEKEINDIIKNLTNLIEKINLHVKLLQVVKEKSEKFFVDKRIEEYFSQKLNSVSDYSSEEEFFQNFYIGMLWLHERFLDVKLPSDLINPECDEIFHQLLNEFSEDLENNYKNSLQGLEGKLNEFFQEMDGQIPESKSGKSVLEKLFEETMKELNNNCFGDSCENKLRKFFEKFEQFDAFLFPLDYLAGVSEKQEIETYRISPEDAKLGLSENMDEKLCKLAGNKLNGFGGFFKKSWRANDILWGRLDGLNRIVEALITEDKIRNFSDFLQRQFKKCDKDSEDKYLRCLLDDVFSLYSLQPDEYKDDLKKLKGELEENLKKLKDLNAGNNTEESSKQKSSKEDFQDIAKKLVEVLVKLGHLFILDEDLQDLKETIQADSKESLSKDRLNKTVMELPIIQLVKKFTGSMFLEDKEKPFCDNKDRICSEGFESIPKSELINIIPRVVRIFQDVLQTSRDKLPINGTPIDRPLWSRLGYRIINFFVIIGLKLFVWRL